MSSAKTTKKNINYLAGIIANHNQEKKLYNLTDDVSKRIKNFLDIKNPEDKEHMRQKIITIMQHPPTRYDGESEESFVSRYYDWHNRQENYEKILSLIEKNI